MNTAIYARYSTDNQNPDTIEVQVAKCADYAQKHGLQIVDIFADEAVSGMKSARPELQRFFAAIPYKQFGCVLIYDQSRFSRDIVDWFTFRRQIQNANIKLISVTQQFVGGDINDPSVFATEGINALVNQIHVLQTRQKTVEKMNYLAKQGKFTGGVPCLGYSIQNGEYVVNETEAEIVRIIFTMHANGESYESTIDNLNRLGLKTKAGKTFGKNSLYSILTNERYIGTLTYNKVKKINGKRNTHSVSSEIIKVENALPAIISKDIWEDVRKRMDGRKRNATNKATVTYLLTGKVICGECGSAMCGEKSNRKYYYYTCSGGKRLRNCTAKSINKYLLEDFVIEQVRSFLNSGIEDLAEKIYSSIHNVHDESTTKKSIILKSIKQVENQLENINNAISEGIYTNSTVEKLRKLEDEKIKLYISLSEAEDMNMKSTKSLQDIQQALSYLAFQQDNVGELLKTCVKKVQCYSNGNVVIVLDPLNLGNEHEITSEITDIIGAADPNKVISVFNSGVIMILSALKNNRVNGGNSNDK